MSARCTLLDGGQRRVILRRENANGPDNSVPPALEALGGGRPRHSRAVSVVPAFFRLNHGNEEWSMREGWCTFLEGDVRGVQGCPIRYRLYLRCLHRHLYSKSAANEAGQLLSVGSAENGPGRI